MKPEEYELMYRVESTHWWYTGMEVITRQLLAQAGLPSSTSARILDAGCGTGGAISAYLSEYGTVIGCDLSSLALNFCQKRNLAKLAQASVTQLPFACEQFDLVTSFDVLYERGVADDQATIVEFKRVLHPAGHLFLRLPAYDWLRGSHDLRIQTARRYTTNQLEKILKNAGFKIKYLSYANMFLFPLALIKRLADKWLQPNREKSDLETRAPLLDPIFAGILSSEAPLITRFGLPFGLSVLALAQKTDDNQYP